MAVADDLTPARLDVTRVAGDADTPLTFTSVTVNGSPLTPDEVIAQVRRTRSRSAELILDRTVDVSGVSFTVGDGDVIPDEPGTWWWDLQVSGTVDGDSFGPLTIVAGTFTVLRDVSHVEVGP